MQKHDGQGEAEAHTKGGTEEAKGGAKMQKINREDVAQAALIVERWCKEHWNTAGGECDCPLYVGKCFMSFRCCPFGWRLEEHLRERGLKDGKV